MTREGYRWAVEWIALNDNLGEDDPLIQHDKEYMLSNISSYITTALVADMFHKSTEEVAKDIYNNRLKLSRD